jgi:hypothetical protein
MHMPLLALALALAYPEAPERRSLQTAAPLAEAQPQWATRLGTRLGVPSATLLAEWQDDRRHYQVNATSRMIRSAHGARGVASMAALPNAPEGARTNFTLGVLQFQSVHGDPNASMAKADALLASGEQGPLDLLVLPELALTGYVFDTAEEAAAVAQPDHGRIFDWAARVARARSTHVLVGMVERGDDEAMYNSALLVSPAGELLATVRKTALTETDAQWAGVGRGAKSMPVVDLPPIGRVGVGICKDMSAVTATSLAGEHAMDESFRRPRPLSLSPRAARPALAHSTLSTRHPAPAATDLHWWT